MSECVCVSILALSLSALHGFAGFAEAFLASKKIFF